MMTEEVPRSAVSKLETQEKQPCSLGLNNGRLKTRKQRFFSWGLKAGENGCPSVQGQFKTIRQEESLLPQPFCPIQAFNW